MRSVFRAALWLLCTALLSSPAPAFVVPDRSWSDQIESASSRFVVLPEFDFEAVLDKETGLVWWRSPNEHNIAPVTPRFALAGCLSSKTGGRLGWRMPSASEILTLALVDVPPSATDSLPPGHPFDFNPATPYWTQTRHLDESMGENAFYQVTFLAPNAVVSLPPSASATHVWCVRGPGPAGFSAEP